MSKDNTYYIWYIWMPSMNLNETVLEKLSMSMISPHIFMIILTWETGYSVNPSETDMSQNLKS